MSNPLVSIVAPCFNGEKYLGTFLDSVLSQEYDNIELILVDDGSTDRTSQVVQDYFQRFQRRGFRLEYFYQENLGQAAAINAGLKRINGEYFMWTDSDDILLSNNVSVKIDFFNNNKDAEFVLGQEELVDFSDVNKTIRITRRIVTGQKDNLFEDMLNGHNVVFGPGTVLVKTSAFRRAVPSFEIFESREGQNWQLMLPLIYTCKWGYVNEVVMKCVRYPESHSRAQRSKKEQLKRNEGIRKLICETINRIPNMQKEEKLHWIKYITEKYTRGSLYKAYEMRDTKLIKEYRKKLIDNGVYSFKSSILGFGLYRLSRMLFALKSRN